MRTLALAALLLAQEPPKEAHLRGVWGNPASIDPAFAIDGRFVSPLFEGLTTFGTDNVTVAPGMAESWSAVGAVWTFKLRDAKWSNGRGVTAEDFMAAWMRILDPELGSPWASSFSIVKNADTYRAGRALDALMLEWESLGPVRRAELLAVAKAGVTRRHAQPLLKLVGSADEQKAIAEIAAGAAAREDVRDAAIGIRAVDKKTLAIELVRPTSWLPEIVAGPAWSPVPPEAIKEHRGRWTDAGKIVTNGPYALDRFTKSDLVLVKSKTYWGKNAGPDRVTLLLTGWPAEAMARWDRAEADWIAGELTYTEKIDDFEKKGDWRSWPLFATWFLRVNMAKAPFDKAGLRTWLALALDRDKAVPKRSLAAKALTPPGVAGYSAPLVKAKDTAAAWGEFAKEVPDASKLPKLILLCPKAQVETALAIKMQIEGDFPDVHIRIDAPEWPGYAKSLEAGDFHMALGGWAGEALDPATFLELFTKAAPLNATGWTSADFDALIASAAAEKDRAKRLEMLSKAEKLLLDGGAVVPMSHPSGGALVRSKVKVDGNAFGRFLLQNVRIQ